MSAIITALESVGIVGVVIFAVWLVFFVGLTQSSDPTTRFKSRGGPS